MYSVAEFLKHCETSSQKTYELMREMLLYFENPLTRSKTRIFFTELFQFLNENHEHENVIQKFHFSFDSLAVGHDDSDHLYLLQLPSTFTPEAWSFTFFEGLARYPVTEFQGKTLVELGTGNGWISIALAKRCLPARMIGLDINPKAITCARLNLYLNALNDKGELAEIQGVSLLDCVEFHESDLLGYCKENKIHCDRVMGCIPQVLNPNPTDAAKMVSESSSDEFLVSLSNYCGNQGMIEDEFGLGLIARSIEEFVEVMKPQAKLILNLGGRPGENVLKRLFTRRGLNVRRVWATRIEQALDTDIDPLVEIEERSDHSFEFFTDAHVQAAIPAKTAAAVQASGRNVLHSLGVYEAKTSNFHQLKTLFQRLGGDTYAAARSALDLDFLEIEQNDEKLLFLTEMIGFLESHSFFEYEDTEGAKSFRRHIAEFFRTYHRIGLTARNIFVAPTRYDLIKNIVTLFSPNKIFMDHAYATLFRTHISKQVYQVPMRTEVTAQLIESLKPQIVVTQLNADELFSSESFVKLCEVTKRNNSLLLLDISDMLELSSSPKPLAMSGFLEQHGLPSHVGLFFGLIHNRVYSELECAALISQNDELHQHLFNCAELTYSRTPLLTQKYYDVLLSELLNFQMKSGAKKESIKPIGQEQRLPKSLNIAEPVQKAFKHAAIAKGCIAPSPSLIRLDYGENALPSPPQIKGALAEAYCRKQLFPEEFFNVTDVKKWLSISFGGEFAKQLCDGLEGNGVAPLFSGILQWCKKESKKMILPGGCYGYFSAASLFHHCDIIELKTEESHHFKVTAQILRTHAEELKGNVLYLNAPTVNPSGVVYGPSELKEIFEAAAELSITIVLDTIFLGLEHAPFKFNLSATQWPDMIVVGGPAKVFAAGGIRFGFLATNNLKISLELKTQKIQPPHKTLLFAFKKIYDAFYTDSLQKFILAQAKELQDRSKTLSKILQQKGWVVLPNQGGLFLVAKPGKGNADSVADELFAKHQIAINNATWTGMPGYCRFVLSVTAEEFKMATERLLTISS